MIGKVRVTSDAPKPLVVRAITCQICGAPADQYDTHFQCQANPHHEADLDTGIFTNRSPDRWIQTAPGVFIDQEAIKRADFS